MVCIAEGLCIAKAITRISNINTHSDRIRHLSMNFIISALLTVHIGVVYVSATGTCQCDAPLVVQRGWTIDYYNYPQYLDVDNSTYYVNGFTDYGPAYAHEYDYTPSINYPQWNSDQGLHDLYGVSITTFNFSVVLSGYFQAPETGTYVVQMTADDGAAVQFGEGSNCSQELSLSVLTCGIVQEVRSGYENGGWGVKTAYLNFEKGNYYPVRIIWWQRAAWVEFLFDMTTPSGNKITGFENTIVQLTTKGLYCPGCVPETSISMPALASRSASYFTYSASRPSTISHFRLSENSAQLSGTLSSLTSESNVNSESSIVSTYLNSVSASNKPVINSSTSIGIKTSSVLATTQSYFTTSKFTSSTSLTTPIEVISSAFSSPIQSYKLSSWSKPNYSSIVTISNDETDSTIASNNSAATISSAIASGPGASITSSTNNILPVSIFDGSCRHNCSISYFTTTSSKHSNGIISVSTSYEEQTSVDSKMSSTTVVTTGYSTVIVSISGIASSSTLPVDISESKKSATKLKTSSDRVAEVSTTCSRHKEGTSSITINTDLAASSGRPSIIMPSISNSSCCISTSSKIISTKKSCNIPLRSVSCNTRSHISTNCNLISCSMASTIASYTGTCVSTSTTKKGIKDATSTIMSYKSAANTEFSTASTTKKSIKDTTSIIMSYKSAATTEFSRAGAWSLIIMESKKNPTIAPYTSSSVQAPSTSKESAITADDFQKSSKSFVSYKTILRTESKTSGMRTFVDQLNPSTYVVESSESQLQISSKFSPANTDNGPSTDTIAMPVNSASTTANKPLLLLILLTVVLSTRAIDLL